MLLTYGCSNIDSDFAFYSSNRFSEQLQQYFTNRGPQNRRSPLSIYLQKWGPYEVTRQLSSQIRATIPLSNTNLRSEWVGHTILWPSWQGEDITAIAPPSGEGLTSERKLQSYGDCTPVKNYLKNMLQRILRAIFLRCDKAVFFF